MTSVNLVREIIGEEIERRPHLAVHRLEMFARAFEAVLQAADDGCADPLLVRSLATTVARTFEARQ